MTLEAIVYSNGKLKLLDQLRLPHETVFIDVITQKDGFDAIRHMNVRGAPAIAITAILTICSDLIGQDFESIDSIIEFVSKSLDYMVTSRPTAVNIAYEAEKLKKFCTNLKDQTSCINEFKTGLIQQMESILAKDIEINKKIGDFGANEILKSNNHTYRLLTHCNTGSLATGGYGTALGVIRSLHNLNKLDHVYCTETRPYMQGSRLTAYELVYEKIPSTLICDSMASILMERKNISAVVVGADRVARNGDTANKVGTYQLAIVAKYHKVPFYVAAPTSSIDLSREKGSEIVIEERAAYELTSINGSRIAAPGINVWNPAFDVTPNNLITGVITEYGVFEPNELAYKLSEFL